MAPLASSIVTMALSCIVSRIKRDIDRDFCIYTLLHNNLLRKTVGNVFALFLSQPSRIPGLLGGMILGQPGGID